MVGEEETMEFIPVVKVDGGEMEHDDHIIQSLIHKHQAMGEQDSLANNKTYIAFNHALHCCCSLRTKYIKERKEAWIDNSGGNMVMALEEACEEILSNRHAPAYCRNKSRYDPNPN